MKTATKGGMERGALSVKPGRLAFTLIELLVVIAVISILAAMVFPITGAVNRFKIRARSKAELALVQAAIETYKTSLGFYPPSETNNTVIINPLVPAMNPLYYELAGTRATNNNTAYVTIDGSSQLPAASLSGIFGPNIGGFLNCTRGSGDEGHGATSFIKGLRQGQFLQVTTNGLPAFFVLGTGMAGPLMLQSPAPLTGKINPWRYNSANPVHNRNSYDLWVDVQVGNKVQRICNWSSEPLNVFPPYAE